MKSIKKNLTEDSAYSVIPLNEQPIFTGWLKRALEIAKSDVDQWPHWMQEACDREYGNSDSP